MQHPAGNAGVEDDMPGKRSEPASEGGVIQNTPHDETRTLPPRPDDEQQSTGLNEEQVQAPANAAPCL